MPFHAGKNSYKARGILGRALGPPVGVCRPLTPLLNETVPRKYIELGNSLQDLNQEPSLLSHHGMCMYSSHASTSTYQTKLTLTIITYKHGIQHMLISMVAISKIAYRCQERCDYLAVSLQVCVFTEPKSVSTNSPWHLPLGYNFPNRSWNIHGASIAVSCTHADIISLFACYQFVPCQCTSLWMLSASLKFS